MTAKHFLWGLISLSQHLGERVDMKLVWLFQPLVLLNNSYFDFTFKNLTFTLLSFQQRRVSVKSNEICFKIRKDRLYCCNIILLWTNMNVRVEQNQHFQLLVKQMLLIISHDSFSALLQYSWKIEFKDTVEPWWRYLLHWVLVEK